jgi:hypothetical protein
VPDFSLSDVAKQVRRQTARRVPPCRHALNDDAWQFEVEPPREHGAHLVQRRIVDDDDRTVARLVAVPVDRVSDGLLVNARRGGQHGNRLVDIAAVLAQDRDSVSVAVLDHEPLLPVEEHAPRRPERQPALVVVLRHVSVDRVLDDLDVPEADAERDKRRRDDRRQRGQPDRRAAPIVGGSGHHQWNRRFCRRSR